VLTQKGLAEKIAHRQGLKKIVGRHTIHPTLINGAVL
jgi:hypothetical protein